MLDITAIEQGSGPELQNDPVTGGLLGNPTDTATYNPRPATISSIIVSKPG